jgi:phage I-like protein
MQIEAYGTETAPKWIYLRSQLPLIGEKSTKSWVQVAVLGDWKGHPAGPFEFTRKTFSKIIANFEAQKNSVPLTYEHPERVSGQPIPAAGWIHELKAENDSLYAYVEFTPRATQLIKDGEYRFCSVVVVFSDIDRVSGEEVGPSLYEVGLTNTPFIDGMNPIKLSRVTGRRELSTSKQRKLSMDSQAILAEIRQILGLPEDSKPEALMKALEGLGLIASAQSGEEEAEPEKEPEPIKEEMSATEEAPAEEVKASEPPPAVEAAEDKLAPEAEANADAEVLAMLKEKSGMDAIALMAAISDNLEAVISAIGGAKAEGTPADEGASEAATEAVIGASKARVAAMSKQLENRATEIEKLSKRIGELELAATERKIDDSIKLGHVLDKDRDKLVKLARTAPELLDDFLGSAKESPAVSQEKITRRSPSGADDSDINENTIAIFERQLSNIIKDKRELRKASIAAIRKIEAARLKDELAQ